jgi:hypothetical protein
MKEWLGLWFERTHLVSKGNLTNIFWILKRIKRMRTEGSGKIGFEIFKVVGCCCLLKILKCSEEQEEHHEVHPGRSSQIRRFRDRYKTGI